MHFVYFLKCRDNSFYCGYTTDLKKRLDAHNKGTGSKYTKRRLPVNLIYSEKFSNKSEAMKREYELKQLTRKQKEELIG